MKEKELQKVAEIIYGTVGADCDACPCSYMREDVQECTREPGEDCLQAIKRKVEEEIKNV
ncbi:MAG: hypothetical protein IJN17_07575 [Clostridia bacterium]|nr:hypothetical protein [Clostridia bacterium]